MPADQEKTYPPVPYERHVFVCTFGKTCPNRGGADIGGELKRRAKEAGITKRIRVNKSGCLNQCSRGPTMVVYPEVIWYGGVKASDIDDILTKTVMRGEVIPRLLLSSSEENDR